MSFRRNLLAVTIVTLTTVPVVSAGIIDRIVATVNGHIILQSDWEDALRFEACEDGRPVSDLSVDQRKAALDHLIDQELLREQMHAADFQHATDQSVSARLQEIRHLYPDASNDAGWQGVLGRCGLNETQLKQNVASQLDLMSLVDARLRSNVHIDSKSIESYYNQEFLPQIRQAGAQEPALADATPQIKELLTQQKVNELMVAWLHDLRSESEIRTEPSNSDGDAR